MLGLLIGFGVGVLFGELASDWQARRRARLIREQWERR